MLKSYTLPFSVHPKNTYPSFSGSLGLDTCDFSFNFTDSIGVPPLESNVTKTGYIANSQAAIINFKIKLVM